MAVTPPTNFLPSVRFSLGALCGMPRGLTRVAGSGRVTICGHIDFSIATPELQAYAERFVRSIKEECLDRIVPLGEWHLRRALTDYVAHYHGERNHQGLGNELIDGPPIQRTRGPVHRRQRMGGILSYYYRSAA